MNRKEKIEKAVDDAKTIVEENRQYLGLDGWNISINYDPDDEENFAYLDMDKFNADYKWACINITNSFQQQLPRDKDLTIIHEMVHIIVEPHRTRLKSFNQTLLNFIKEQEIMDAEKMVEHLTIIIKKLKENQK